MSNLETDYFDRFKKRIKQSGNDLRSAYIKNSRDNLKQVFGNDPSYKMGIYRWVHGNESDDYEDESTLAIRMYNHKFSSANGNTVNFMTQVDTPVYAGDIFYDSENDTYWICTEAYLKSDINYEGTLTLCTWILRWQNDKGDIFNYPCFITNATQYNSGEQQRKQIVVGSAQFHVKLPYDENTVCIKSPKRFYIDRNSESPVVYKTTDNDTISFANGSRGLVKLTVEEDEENLATDRVDLGICDYIDPDVIQNTQSTNTENPDNTQTTIRSEITYKTNVIKSGGKAQTFEGKFYQDNEVLDTVGDWEIISNFANDLQVTKNGNKITIKVDNDDLIDEEFKLVFKDENDENESSVIIKIVSLI